MPVYKYRCPVCGETVEVVQKHDAPAPECKTCVIEEIKPGEVAQPGDEVILNDLLHYCGVEIGGPVRMVRVPSTFSFSFKGGKPT